jgi:hypothetical protein
VTAAASSFTSGERGAMLVIATGILALSAPTAVQVLWLIAVALSVVFSRVSRTGPADPAPGAA